VRGEYDAGASGVEAVGGVADGADSGDISDGEAAAEDGLVDVLPGAGLELECDFAYLAVRAHVDCGLQEEEKSDRRKVRREIGRHR
jgi:hypothetical protein